MYAARTNVPSGTDWPTYRAVCPNPFGPVTTTSSLPSVAAETATSSVYATVKTYPGAPSPDGGWLASTDGWGGLVSGPGGPGGGPNWRLNDPIMPAGTPLPLVSPTPPPGPNGCIWTW